MQVINLLTINILSDLSRWAQREHLLFNGIRFLNPDIVLIQEARLSENIAGRLAESIGLDQVVISPQKTSSKPLEGIATLCRIPIEKFETFDLGSQARVAQAIEVHAGGSNLIVVNGHFFWQPGDSEERLKQIERLIAWLKDFPQEALKIIGGDFNGTPETRAIRRMIQFFPSAYYHVHGTEPEYTAPTPLKRSKISLLKTAWRFYRLINLKDFKLKWAGTLDYIFVDPRLNVLDCKIVLNRSDPENPSVYPSDHFGIFARIQLP